MADLHYHLISSHTGLHNSSGGFGAAMAESATDLADMIARDVRVYYMPRVNWEFHSDPEREPHHLPAEVAYTATIFPCDLECDAWQRHQRALARSQESPQTS